MKNNNSLIYNSFLIIGDVVALVVAFLGAFFVRAHLFNAPVAYPVHITTYILVFSALLPFWVLTFALLGLYNHSIYEKRFSEIGRLFIGSFIGMLFVVFWNYLSLKPILPSKLVVIFGFAFGFIALVIVRNIIRLSQTLMFRFRVGLTNVVLTGNTAVARELVESLYNSRQSGYYIVGVVGSERAIYGHSNIKNYPDFQTMLESVKADSFDAIIQTELYVDESRNQEILEFAQRHHIAYRFVPGNTELFVGNIDVELFRSAIPVIAVNETALFGWGRIVKRLFDILVGGLLQLIALPFMLIIAIVIKLYDHGPILLKQTRLTRYDQKFTVYKFRTIKKTYHNLSPEAAFTKMGEPQLITAYRDNGDQIPHDPRYSKLGNFLRATSLDELPQLFNIVKGDISLVGPRSLVPEELEVYAKRHTILSVRSGLTGLAQVSGRRNISFEERRKLDLYYVQNWSFWLDLTILAKTIGAIIDKRGGA
ncbi:MAG TPA: sugar transferase [Candidatus Saccharimonadales bacterium]|jgi:exopolysaccharide biosynthesis polyprenyl glycosylphosphotransferase|nr:sugar transferase [Candidatus Saccharimonadales bacterium]